MSGEREYPDCMSSYQLGFKHFKDFILKIHLNHNTPGYKILRVAQTTLRTVGRYSP